MGEEKYISAKYNLREKSRATQPPEINGSPKAD
jgi:hypothetical protein